MYLRYLLISALLLAPLSTQAATLLADEIIAPPDAITDDLYAAGNRIQLDHDVAGDVYVVGEEIDIQGAVAADIVAAGRRVTIAGPVQDDLFAAGETVTIKAPTLGDLFAAGATITISPETTITGDAFLAGERIDLAGTIRGDVRVAGANVRVADGTLIEGSLISYGETPPSISPGATINGDITHRQAEMKQASPLRSALLGWVRGVITWFVIGLLIILLAPAASRHLLTATRRQATAAFGLGILWLVLVIPVSLIGFITIIGVPLAFALLLLTALTWLVAIAYANIFVGHWIASRVTKQSASDITWQHVLLGVVIMKTLQLIPIIGWLIVLIITTAVFGATLIAAWHTLRQPSPTAPTSPVP